MNNSKLRVAVIGASRGKTFIKSCKAMPEQNVELAAICDTSPERLAEWESESHIKLYSNYEQVLEDRDIDIVCIATPVSFHASQSVAALNAGKHVLCEVTAAGNLQECRDLVEAVQKSGKTYMMAENYCFTEAALQVENMVEQGVFGELTYASGAYIHDVKELFFNEDGSLTWRGEGRRPKKTARPCLSYPTHSIGPVARWLGINRTDRFDRVSAWSSQSSTVYHRFVQKNYPDQKHLLEPGSWRPQDNATATIQTDKGILIDLRFDASSPRPHNMSRYELQGTKASYTKPDGMSPGLEPLIWIEDLSPASDKGIAKSWEPLFKYREEFQHPLWRQYGKQAQEAGHGGGDYFLLREFVAAIREERMPMIDVYDAVTWSSLVPLTADSIEEGNVPIKFPDFKTNK